MSTLSNNSNPSPIAYQNCLSKFSQRNKFLCDNNLEDNNLFIWEEKKRHILN